MVYPWCFQSGAMMSGTNIGENDKTIHLVELDGKTYRIISHKAHASVAVQVERRLPSGTIYRFFRNLKAGTPQFKKVLAK